MDKAMETKRISSPAKCGLLVSLRIFPFLLCAGVIWKLTLLEGFPFCGYIGFCPIPRARSSGHESWYSPCNKMKVLLPNVGNMLICVAWRLMEVNMARRARVLGKSREDVSCLIEGT